MSTGTQCCDPRPPSIRAVVSNDGDFAVGGISTLIFRLNDSVGNPINPDTIKMSIKDFNGITIIIKCSNGSVMGTLVTPLKIADGFYMFLWFIDSGVVPGRYTIVWLYTIDTLTFQILLLLVVSLSVAVSACLQRIRDMVQSLKYLLCCALNVPRYNLQAKPSVDCRTFYFTKPLWNTNPGQTRIYRNGHTIVTLGITIDYTLGRVQFDYPLSASDWISADYSFSWFDDLALRNYLLGAVSIFNAAPPFSKYTLCSVPLHLSRAIVYKAATDAIRLLIMCLMFPLPAQLFGGHDRAQQVAGTLLTLKKNYLGDWRLVFLQKKFGPWPKSQWISIPEYTLPGGRSRWFRYMFSGGA